MQRTNPRLPFISVSELRWREADGQSEQQRCWRSASVPERKVGNGASFRL